MSAWAGWAAVKALLVTAGAGLSQPMKLVERGMPVSVPTDMIRFWYGGSGPRISTFQKTHDAVVLTVAVILRMGAGASREAEGRLDERLEEADAAVRAALLGGYTLGGIALNVVLEDSEATVENWNGQDVRIVRIPVAYWRSDSISVSA